MSIWVLKALIQKIISFLPLSHKINYLFQKHITKGLELTDKLFEEKLLHCKNHIQAIQNYGNHNNSLTVLEIGSGWYPIVPIGLYLFGAKIIFTVDITHLFRVKNIKCAIQKYLQYFEQNKLSDYLHNVQKERILNLKEILINPKYNDVTEILKRLNIDYLIIDEKKLSVKDESIDLITSNNTFEHISEAHLYKIFKDFKRVAGKNCVMSHFIDMSDHFAHIDKTITDYNFMKFSERMWKIIDNNIQPQNRLRLTDFRDIHNTAGFKIISENNITGDKNALTRIKLDGSFKSIPSELLSVTHTTIISKLI